MLKKFLLYNKLLRKELLEIKLARDLIGQGLEELQRRWRERYDPIDPERIRLIQEGARENQGRLGNIDLLERMRQSRPREFQIDTNGNTKRLRRNEPLSNSPSMAEATKEPAPLQLSSRQAASSNQGSVAHETPLDDPYVVYRGPPDYTFTSLPYIRESYESRSSNYVTIDQAWRMNSPYDVGVS